MVTTQAVKGGFALNLGRTDGADPKVHTSQVRALLDQMRASPGYDQARSKFEFRLQERDGQTYLQLKERNWAGRLKGMLGLSQASQERRAAMNLLEQHYGLSAGGRAQGAPVHTGQAVAFVQGHAAQWRKTADDLANPFAYQVLPDRSQVDVRALLARAQQGLAASGRADPGGGELGPLASMFDKDVLKSLASCKVQVEGGRLILSTDGQPDGLSVGQRLEAIVGFVEKHTGSMRATHPEQFQRVLDRLMRNEPFKFASDLTHQIADQGVNDGGLGANALLQSRATAFEFNGQGFRISQTAQGPVLLGGVTSSEDRGLVGSLANLDDISASQSFTLNLQDLAREDFDIAHAAQNLDIQDRLSADFNGREKAAPSVLQSQPQKPSDPAPVINPFQD